MNPHPLINTGYKPPVAPDSRNYILEKAQPVQPFPPSYKTDISALDVYMQEQIPDCVENAVTKIHQYYIYKTTGKLLNLSRRFLAYWTVQLDGFPITDGTSLLNALKEARKRGICEAQYHPDDHNLDIETFSTVVPSAAALANGLTHTISNFVFLSDLSEQGLKNAINQNGMIVVGLQLDKSWWTSITGVVTWLASLILPLRIPTDKASMSGHAIVLYGYDEQYFNVLNSFSDQWGDKGTGYFSKEYLPYIFEAGTVIDLTPQQVQQVQQADQIVNTVDQLQKVENPQNTALINNIISMLWQGFLSLFKGTK